MKTDKQNWKISGRKIRRIVAGAALVCMLGSLPIGASAAPQKHSYRFEDKGYHLILDGNPEKAAIPGVYREAAKHNNWTSPYTDYNCKAILCDLDGDEKEELFLFHGLEDPSGESMPQMAASIYTVKDGKAVPVIQDYPMMNMVGDCNSEIQILEQGGSLFLGLEDYGAPEGMKGGKWELYRLNGTEAECLISAEYEWNGTPLLNYGFYETLPEQCHARVNGQEWTYEDFRQLQNQMHVIYRSRIYGYDTDYEVDFGKKFPGVKDAWRIQTTMGW